MPHEAAASTGSSACADDDELGVIAGRMSAPRKASSGAAEAMGFAGAQPILHFADAHRATTGEERMTAIVEHTPERLVIELGTYFPHNATCVLDKTTGRARFERQ